MVIIENNETNSDKRNETYLAERSQRFYAFVLDALFSFSVSFAIPLILSPFIKDADLIIALLCFVIVISVQGYLLINTGQSIGKRLMNIRIVDSVSLKIPSIKNVFWTFVNKKIMDVHKNMGVHKNIWTSMHFFCGRP